MLEKIGSWSIFATVDDDGHLTVGISHNDESKVICIDADIAINDTEWSDRFTTETIECDWMQNGAD